MMLPFEFLCHLVPVVICVSCLEKRNRWILLCRPVGQNEVSSVPSYSPNVLVFPPTCHHSVVAAIPTRVLTTGTLGVTKARSWWYPHFLFPDVGLSRSPPVGLPMGSSFWVGPGFLGVNLECSW